MDETYIKVSGQWFYYYRAVDENGDVMDYYLSEHRDEKSAHAFLCKAIAQNGWPDKIVSEGSASNHVAIDNMTVQFWLSGVFMLCLIDIIRVKYLNNIVGQSHRRVKQKTRQALGWKSIEGAETSLHGKGIWGMLKRDQIDIDGETAYERFYALAA